MNKYCKLIIIFVLYCLNGSNSNAQIFNPVSWNFRINDQSEIEIKATIQKGWHLYGMTLPEKEPRPFPTEFHFDQVKGAELVGKVTSNSPLIKKYDDIFEMEVNWYEKEALFIQKIKVTQPDQFLITGSISYMSCDDAGCVPGDEDFSLSKKNLPAGLSIGKKSETVNAASKEDLSLLENTPSDIPLFLQSEVVQIDHKQLWQPVIEELTQMGKAEQKTIDRGWLIIFLLGFGGGFIALLTPCVWPIIPMTVSFFLKRSKTDRKRAILDAVIYGISIIVIYLISGLLITVIFGASALNELSTNAFFNLLFFGLLVLFAISFFGAFELTLPASWSTRLDRKADSTTGLISIFFMAFTLVLVSFSCTGPIIGTLLVEAAVRGNMIGPAIGMFGFAFALAIPFALFAIFPSWLQNLPKSGGWLNTVKVVLGFLELALALKFLSVADLAYGWGILDREVFLVLWIIIFLLLGMYLLGKIKFAHDSDLPHVSVTRLFLATLSLAFALYMVPGLWGAPLKAISAFSPPLYTQDFNLYHGEVRPEFKDYEAGMEFAFNKRKPVLIDFTGYGCVNCRNMEAAVWTNQRVKNIIDNEYVLISLYVDDKTPLPKPIEIEESGKLRKLKTIGDKWSYLQRSKFGANAQPFYVLLDNQGFPIGPAYAYDTNVDKYVEFLKKGIEEFKVKSKK